MDKIYAVMVEGKQTPSKTYDHYEDAVLEAKRLTHQERRTVYVLVAVVKMELNDIKVTQL